MGEKKKCVNASCSMREMSIRTEKDACLGCGKELKADDWSQFIEDLMKGHGGLFGD